MPTAESGPEIIAAARNVVEKLGSRKRYGRTLRGVLSRHRPAAGSSPL
jgi:hypothetical protein